MKKKNPTIRKKIITSRKDDQFGVILESINSKLDLTLESFGVLDKKIDRVHAELKAELKNEIGGVRAEMRIFRDDVDEKFKQVDENFKRVDENFKKVDENFKGVDENFKKVFEFQDRAEANFEVTLEYLSRLDDEIQDLKKEMKKSPSLMAVFEKRMKIIEKDFVACKKALALR